MRAAHTTRRALFAAAAAIPVAITAAGRAQAEPAPNWRDFFASVASLHPRALDAAHTAASAGLDPADCVGIALEGRPVSGGYPAMFFRAGNGGTHTVQPDRILWCEYYRRPV